MFTTTLDLRADRPGVFVLLAPLIYKTTWNRVIKVPVGFETDFASIPRAVQVLPGFSPNGKSRSAAVLHDFLYSKGGGDYPRSVCDSLFRHALVECGVARLTAMLMYLGVRAGGWATWKKR